MLTVTVTHLKEGYLRRNGLPRSDKATLTEHWIRNGDFLTVMTIINDPVYLTEPFVRTTDYELDLQQQVPPYPCGVVQEVDRKKGEIPRFLPGTNPYMTEFATRHKLPVDATRGGAETMYPDFLVERPRRKPTAARPTTRHACRRDRSAHQDIQVLPVRGNVYMLLGRRRQHHRLGRARRRADGGCGPRADDRPGARGHSASCRTSSICASSRLGVAPRRGRAWPAATSSRRPSRSATSSTPSADPDHAGGNEKIRAGRPHVHRRQRRRQHRRRR